MTFDPPHLFSVLLNGQHALLMKVGEPRVRLQRIRIYQELILGVGMSRDTLPIRTDRLEIDVLTMGAKS